MKTKLIERVRMSTEKEKKTIEKIKRGENDFTSESVIVIERS